MADSSETFEGTGEAAASAVSPDDSGHEPLRAPFLIEDGFLPPEEAEDLRAHVDAHFARPEAHQPDTHQVWNYWYVPGLYTYLRTLPERIVPEPLVDGFRAALTRWASERLGLSNVSRPYLSLYVDGCGQGLHNDSANGRFGYVYSLTRADRASRGGQTIVLKEGDLFRSRLNRPDAGSGLYDLIEPDFNRLTVFDDRMPHGVQRVEGTMDPVEGRLVLHGHISEGPATVAGPLDPAEAERVVVPVIMGLIETIGLASPLYHGPVVLRLFIDEAGAVSHCRLLVDRVARTDGGNARSEIEALVEGIAAARFPAADAPSVLTLPLMIGGPLPWMVR